MTEAGVARSVDDLSQYSQIPLSEIHKTLGSVQAVFLNHYAVHSVAVPVGATLADCRRALRLLSDAFKENRSCMPSVRAMD